MMAESAGNLLRTIHRIIFDLVTLTSSLVRSLGQLAAENSFLRKQ